MKTFHGAHLSWDTTDRVIEVKLHHGSANEIGTGMLRELETLADHLSAGAGGAGALIFHSDRRAGFSAGADLRELYNGIVRVKGSGVRAIASRMLERPGSGRVLSLAGDMLGNAVKRGGRAVVQPLVAREVRRFLTRIHAVFNTIDTAPLLTIAATHGVVFGGGFELALTCDLIIADKSSRFAFPELRLGIIPGFGGIPRLERQVGNAVVRDFLLTGRSMRAKRAHELGIVSQVTARGEALTAARATAAQATRFDPETFRVGKAFAKPLPAERLEQEIETFVSMLANPAVEAGLERFVNSNDVRPYLP